VDVQQIIRQEWRDVCSEAELKSRQLSRSSDLEKGFEIINCFLLDLLGLLPDVFASDGEEEESEAEGWYVNLQQSPQTQAEEGHVKGCAQRGAGEVKTAAAASSSSSHCSCTEVSLSSRDSWERFLLEDL